MKTETVEAILRQAVVDHQLLSGNLFDYIVGPLRQDKLLSLMSMSCHRVHQLANSHNSTYQPKDHDIIGIMENPPEVTVLCSDQVVADQEGVKDLRKSLSYIIQYRIYMLKEYSTLTSELFATATQEQEKKKFSVNRNATPTNREVYLQLLDTMPAAMEDDIPDTGIDEMFSQLRNSEHVDQTSQQFNAMEKVLIPTGQGQFLKKHSGQQPRLQKKGCYLQADMGTCSRDKCRFDHSEEVLRETRKSQHFQEPHRSLTRKELVKFFFIMIKDTFCHDMESYGTVWYQGLDLPGVPEQRYYDQVQTRNTGCDQQIS